MITQKLSKRILEGMLIGALTFGNAGKLYAPNITSDMENSELVKETTKNIQMGWLAKEQSVDGIKKPYYNLKSNHCSQYARLSAKKLFGKEYHGADAWNLKYSNPVVYEIKEGEDMRDLIINGVLGQGMMVNSRWPVKDIRKYGKNGKDIKGEPIEDTHVVLYFGIDKREVNKNGHIISVYKPVYLHQWGSIKEKKTQEELKKDYNLDLTRLIDSP